MNNFKPIESDSINFLQIIVSPKMHVNQLCELKQFMIISHLCMCSFLFINVSWILNSIAMETIKPRKIKLNTTQYNNPHSL